MAMACLRLFTRLPCFFFLKCRISVRTSWLAFLPYFLPPLFLRAILRCSFLDGILPSNRDALGFGQVGGNRGAALDSRRPSRRGSFAEGGGDGALGERAHDCVSGVVGMEAVVGE